MARYVTVSRAARLAGVSRGTLQKRIRNGDLSTFEGMVEVNELLRVFPETQMEETALLRRVEEIMESAVTKVVHQQPTLPDAETLAARVSALTHELGQVNADVASYQVLLEKIEIKLAEVAARSSGQTGEEMNKICAWLARAVEQREVYADSPHQLMAREAFLRIMEASVKVFPSGREFAVQGTETLLESALKAGQVPEYGCSDGTCGLCKARVVSGRVRQVRDFSGLSAEDKQQHRIPMCAYTALTDLVIEAEEAGGPRDIRSDQRIEAQVKGVERRSDDVMLVNVRTPHARRLRFMAGQYVVLHVRGLEPKECFIASCPCEERNLQFHLSRGRSAALVEAMMRSLDNADPITIEGPRGEFTLQEDSARPSVLIALSLGFAPIKSILEHAMSVDSKESISLYWTAGPGGHYMHNLCRAWADAIDDFHYVPLTTSAEVPVPQLLVESLRRDHIDFQDADFYIAGPRQEVEAVTERLMQQDIDPGRIHSQGI